MLSLTPVAARRRAEPALPMQAATVLLANGQTTEGTRLSVERLSAALGHPARLRVRWGEATLYPVDGSGPSVADVDPAGIDISRVAAAEAVIEAVCTGLIPPGMVAEQLDTIGRMPPVPLARLAPMAAAGAAALSVIFGAPDILTVTLVAAIAGAGALLRRVVARCSGNPLLQPLAASLLAGLTAGLAVRAGLAMTYRLVAVCPCMILVPGPHVLNGMLDLVRVRIPLGAARLALAGLVVVAICAGLLSGLALAGASFPEAGATRHVPLALDAVAAGIAVAAYASFFNMPWRMVAAPVATGMAAHALRWELLQSGFGTPSGAFGASLVAGTAMTLLSHRLRLPFGAAAFACVVSLVPGIYMFQAASGVESVVQLGPGAGLQALLEIAVDTSTAGLVVLAISAGLILPRLVADEVLLLRKTGPG